MKNKEFYKDKIYEIACRRDDFAVNKMTKEICGCVEVECHNCLFHSCPGGCYYLAMDWLEQEHIEPVLNDVEKRYLEAVLMPFKDRVQSIQKKSITETNAYIRVFLYLYSDTKYMDFISFPYFDGTKMYTGMKKNKCYTLEELGLFTDEEENNEE